ncbi:MAG: HNH endonuclease [bacterium]
MRAYVAITDGKWFDFLSHLTPAPDEVNFWQPGPRGAFGALEIAEPILFKLHRPNDFIVGGGFFSHWTRLPVSLAWEAFEQKNGAESLTAMRVLVDRYRRPKPAPHEDPDIGCLVLLQPFFLPRQNWIPVPEWHPNIVSGKVVDLGTEPWQSVWDHVERFLPSPELRYSEPKLVRLRLGQGTFRVLVTDAYRRRCAVTGEKVLPVLHAAHIRSYADGGEHRVDNGLLLRSDLHILFDKGYITVTPDYRVEVSRRLRTDFNNGEEYLRWRGGAITLPQSTSDRPRPEFLVWHNDHKFIA